MKTSRRLRIVFLGVLVAAIVALIGLSSIPVLIFWRNAEVEYALQHVDIGSPDGIHAQLPDWWPESWLEEFWRRFDNELPRRFDLERPQTPP